MLSLEKETKMHEHESPAQKKAIARKEVLDAAAKAVLQDRNASYGSPESNFQDIADVWNWFLSDKIAPGTIEKMDVANMMILMKMARLKYNPNHRDSKVDVAGYAACAAECETKSSIQTTKGETPTDIINQFSAQNFKPVNSI